MLGTQRKQTKCLIAIVPQSEKLGTWPFQLLNQGEQANPEHRAGSRALQNQVQASTLRGV